MSDKGMRMAGDDTFVTAGEALVDLLRLNGIDKVFSVPGESFLPVLEALRQAPDIELVICRQEGGVTMMAEAWGKLTGRPGICFVTRGPGGANAIAGLHVASQDSTPLILFVGQVPRDYLDREAWQEIDPRALYGSMTKWAAQIHDPARLPEYVSRAFHTALAGRPGPVVLGLPEDMLSVKVQVPALHRAPATQSRPAPQAIASLQEMLASAERPLAIVGGVGWTAQAREQMHAFAARNSLPVATAFRRQDRFDNTWPEYAGEAGLGINPRLADRIRQSDLLLAIGTRLGDVVTGHYQLVSVPRPHQRLVHVHADLQELGRVYQPDLAIGAGVVQCCAAMAAQAPPIEITAERRAWLTSANRDYLEWSMPNTMPGPLQLAEVVAWLARELPAGAVVSNGAGNYTLWVQRFFKYRALGSQLAPTSGSMGYGLPSAIAAKLADPSRLAVCFAGDGCFLITGQELATAVKYRANVIIIVVNNGSYGSIRMHQERHYAGQYYGTDLVNPDFVAYAHAFGAAGFRVERTEDFPAAFREAAAAGRPALIELPVDAAVLKP